MPGPGVTTGTETCCLSLGSSQSNGETNMCGASGRARFYGAQTSHNLRTKLLAHV